MLAGEGRRRVVIERVSPQVDDGRFPVKRVVGETVEVEADIFADGHDALAAVLLHRFEDGATWDEVPMVLLENDRWRGRFTVDRQGRYRFTIRAWVDRFGTWQRALAKKVEAEQEVSVELQAGANTIERTAAKAAGSDRALFRNFAKRIREGGAAAAQVALDPELTDVMGRYPDRRLATGYDHDVPVEVDRERARFSAWYELFPRSASADPGRPGTFKDVIERLPYVAGMGFDVLYLPPIHPIGRSYRKGRNNVTASTPEDPGSPWAIGSEDGGHTAIHPDLGTMEDFHALLDAASDHGLEIALDLAYQCAPDHPYVREHPEWFRHLPDGTIQHAENPPKKYQDIYPLDFECQAWRDLWDELKSVVEHWIDQGIRLFRVDNPHTKPFAFWDWLISEIKAEHPDVLFLAEAFTRPRVMHRLAKLGFTQSYTYFAWRTTKRELTQYFGTDLPDVREFFRPNLWPNTPDILTEQLQTGGRPVFMQRLVLAATLGANYGIYGPAFELMEHEPLHPGSEEYLNSEKYEIRWWDLDGQGSLAEFIGRINRIRRENPALQTDRGLQFHPIDNERMIAYSKRSETEANMILVVVNLDPRFTQDGWVELPLEELDIDQEHPFQVHDLVTGARYLWSGPRNFVRLNPHVVPAHVFRIRRRIRTERDFEYSL